MLNTTQLTTLKNAILAETDPTFVSARNAGATGAMAEWFNSLSTTEVWKNITSVAEIDDAILWSNFTPNDAPDGTALCTNRFLSIQTKQMNLQKITMGKDYVNTSRANIRDGLRDAVIALPSGAGGASRSAGGANGVTVLNVCKRFATKGEKLFATVPATTGSITAKLLTFEGTISNEDVVEAINS